MKRRVVITGLGLVTPLGCRVDQVWNRLVAGESGIRPITAFDTTNHKVKFGGEAAEWDPSNLIEHREFKRLDRFTHFAITAAVDCIAQSGLDFTKFDTTRCGCILGSGIGGLGEIETQTQVLLEKGPHRVSALTVPKMMLNAAGGNISIRFGLRGPNYSVATACASATNAMGDAMRAIQYDDADVMITGGTEAAVTPLSLAAFGNMRALSDRNDNPSAASRPFDKDRDGFVLGEGAGILVFEELEFAKARGATILAEVLGYGGSTDAGHITQPDEQGLGAARAMQNALRDAKLNPDQIEYVNAHGTSTPLGDKAETAAVKYVFGDQARKLSISSTKSMLGHSLGASGGIELVVTVKSLLSGVIHPTANLDNQDPDCDLDYTAREARQRPIRSAMSNSFGFGGHNASIIVGQVR